MFDDNPPAPPAPPPAPRPANPRRERLLNAAISLALSVFVAWLATRGIVVPVPVLVVAEPTAPTTLPKIDPPAALAFGWNDTPELIAVAKANVKTVFRSTPAGADTPLPKSVYQWQTRQRVTGRPKPEKNQNPVGSCVAFGSTTAAENALACAVAAGVPFEFIEFSEEVAYALTRVDIGRGELRGQDGAVGGWAARAWTELGGLPQGKFDGVDYTDYDPARCRKLGDNGVSVKVKAECAKFRVGDAALLRTWLDVKKALASGCGVFTCSRIGFSASRDINGVCVEQGQWGHCMNIDGYHVTEDGYEYAHFDNSWNGFYHRGPVGWGEPNGAGFWAKSSTVARMLSEGDSYALSAVKGMPLLELNWDVMRPARPFADPYALLRPGVRPMADHLKQLHLAP